VCQLLAFPKELHAESGIRLGPLVRVVVPWRLHQPK
jgi:hypothetical protein